MAREITCDMCHEEPAEIMYSTFTDGSTLAVGPLCAPQFVYGLAIALGILPDPSEVPAEPDPVPAKRPRRQSKVAAGVLAEPAESDAEAPAEVG